MSSRVNEEILDRIQRNFAEGVETYLDEDDAAALHLLWAWGQFVREKKLKILTAKDQMKKSLMSR
ncbi:MAG: hypothetical protein OK422_01530 [Thaumarchaeota archaeon]|nr:hypothetical protein [Nitrososphaerota archaeon]